MSGVRGGGRSEGEGLGLSCEDLDLDGKVVGNVEVCRGRWSIIQTKGLFATEVDQLPENRETIGERSRNQLIVTNKNLKAPDGRSLAHQSAM